MNKALVFNDVEMSKKEFYDAKKAIPLNLVDVGNIVVSNKVTNNNETSKYFIGYLNGINEINPLLIILPQMSGYIKYFENGGKNISFKIKDDNFYVKYTQIWNKIKELLGVKFYSEPIHDDKYIKVKVKTFIEKINTFFTGNSSPKEKIEYICIPVISVDSVLRLDRKNHPQVYLKECKYKIRKRELKSFIVYGFDSDSESD